MGFSFHFPLIIIFLPMLSAVFMPLVKKAPIARFITLMTSAFIVFFASGLLISMLNADKYAFIYQMGYYSAPWGNELRAGLLEVIFSIAFSVVMFLSVIGTGNDLKRDIRARKLPLYYCMVNLLSASLMALLFTNDLFNAYVFIEITTIAACAIVVAKENKDTLRATIKYLFLSVMGSGLFLLALAILYSITGQLSMESVGSAINFLVQRGEYQIPLLVSLLLFVVAIAVKSALFPFHTWLPDAHGSATTASSAILSGLVIKGYIVLLLKIIFRVYGLSTIQELGMLPPLFIFGITGMMVGSIMACFQTKIKRLIAYSSVSQIGYIFMGIGLNSYVGFSAASFHIIAHSFTKSMLFIAAGVFISYASSPYIKDLTGVGRKNKLAGVAFLVGTLSMTGIPLFAGFVSKFYLAGAAVGGQHHVMITMTVLALSTFLNSIYYFPVLFKIFSKGETTINQPAQTSDFFGKSALLSLTAFNIVLGILFIPILDLIERGIMWLN